VGHVIRLEEIRNASKIFSKTLRKETAWKIYA